MRGVDVGGVRSNGGPHDTSVAQTATMDREAHRTDGRERVCTRRDYQRVGAREHRGWTQEHLAKVTDVDKRTVQRIEMGETKAASLETCQALAAALDVDVATIQHRATLASVLEDVGANVGRAASVATARAALRVDVLGVVISDIAMPDEDGFDSTLRGPRHFYFALTPSDDVEVRGRPARPRLMGEQKWRVADGGSRRNGLRRGSRQPIARNTWDALRRRRQSTYWFMVSSPWWLFRQQSAVATRGSRSHSAHRRIASRAVVTRVVGPLAAGALDPRHSGCG
jgi:DNA-binding XRE family transcriptional regulator